MQKKHILFVEKYSVPSILLNSQSNHTKVTGPIVYFFLYRPMSRYFEYLFLNSSYELRKLKKPRRLGAGHDAAKTPHPVRSAKLSNSERG